MKRFIIYMFLLLASQVTKGQIVITPADMPKAGDTIRHSNASPLSAIDLTTTGPAQHWAFTIEPTSQAIDTFKKAYQVNPLFAASISLAANGYKVADSIPGISYLIPGISIQNVYSFYETLSSPNAYAATFLAASILGFPFPIHYTTPDAIYFFPLNYLREDSSDFELNISVTTIGIKQKGYRKTKVDGWGDIVTPYFATPKSCLRLRSEIHEIDSILLDTLTIGLPRTTVEYKWLVNGEHYPAMWVTATSIAGLEIVTDIRYRDYYRPELDSSLSVKTTFTNHNTISAYPNPAAEGFVTLNVPATTQALTVELYDMQARLVGTHKNEKTIDIRRLAPGNYIARVTADDKTSYVRIVR